MRSSALSAISYDKPSVGIFSGSTDELDCVPGGIVTVIPLVGISPAEVEIDSRVVRSAAVANFFILDLL
jgi:hypothetical protein